MATRVGVYARISDDLVSNALGVGRQEEDGRALAAIRRWEVTRAYVDNDLSAFKKRVRRPAFEQMLDDLRDGVIDGIIAYDLDRFARQPKDLERAIDIYDDRKGAVFATAQGDVDLSTSDGRTMARVMVAFANKSSMDTSRRVTRKHLATARTGKPVGGTRPFGWKADKTTIDPAEAALIRDAVDAILDRGQGIHSILRKWAATGVKTPKGNVWRRSPLRNMLLSPRLAGYRVHQGGIARHADGAPVTGLYEPIIEVERWEKLVAVLTTPKAPRQERPGQRKFLLSGIARCGTCSGKLVGNADPRAQGHNYVCQSPACAARVGINGPKTDLAVLALTRALLEQHSGALLEVEGQWPRVAELADLLNEQQEALVDYRDQTRTTTARRAALDIVDELELRIGALRVEQDHWLREHSRLEPSTASEQLDSEDPELQRAAVLTVLDGVVIQRASKLGPKFDPDRIVPLRRDA